MKQVADKMRAFGCENFMLTERGTADSLNHIRTAAGDTGRLVGLLQRVG